MFRFIRKKREQELRKLALRTAIGNPFDARGNKKAQSVSQCIADAQRIYDFLTNKNKKD